MKKLLIIAAIFSVSFTAYAQEPNRKELTSPENIAERKTSKMTEKLNLNEDQQKEVYAIHLRNAEERQNDLNKRRAEQESRKAEMRAKHKAQEKEIAAVLTPEQKTQWAALQSQRTNTYKNRGPEGNSNRRHRHGSKTT